MIPIDVCSTFKATLLEGESMLKKLMIDVTSFLKTTAGRIGDLINETPKKSELKKVKRTPRQQEQVWAKNKTAKPMNEKVKKKVIKTAKGTPATETKTFNKPRG
jgi:hypothetical protein